METVAVFFEKPVRTYGLAAKGGCVLLCLECTASQMLGLAERLADLQPPLRLISCSVYWEEDETSLQVCLPEDEAVRLEKTASMAGAQVRQRREASVICLQGPHFGDRWGVAKEALDGLEQAGVQPLCLLGVTHTLQVTLEPIASPAALAGIGQRFVASGGDLA